MLIDAIRAELWRFWHNGTAIFWGLFFIPLSGFVVGVFWRHYLGGKIVQAREALVPGFDAAPKVMVLGDKLVDKTASLADPGLIAFFLIAAAALFASDYRWETWRLIRPRNSRQNQILGKALAMAAVALVPLLCVLLGEAMGQIINATLDRTRIAIGFKGDHFIASLGLIGLAWWRVCQFALLALATAVVTRSMAASLLVPLAIGVGLFMLQRMTGFFGWTPTDWSTLLAFPAVGFEHLQSAIMGAKVQGLVVVKSLLGIVLWTAAPLALTLYVFDNQDLSKE